MTQEIDWDDRKYEVLENEQRFPHKRYSVKVTLAGNGYEIVQGDYGTWEYADETMIPQEPEEYRAHYFSLRGALRAVRRAKRWDKRRAQQRAEQQGKNDAFTDDHIVVADL